jgi:DNA-3-methyladenine glycosylase I
MLKALMSNEETRCNWALGAATDYVEYHDQEWGIAIRDDRALYERICLEGFQAGLSWWTILSRREDFRELFANFDPKIVVGFGEVEIASLRTDRRIIRHEGKIRAAIGNAKATLELGTGGLTRLVWSYQPSSRRRPSPLEAIPAQSTESLALARALKSAGYSFIGPTSAYSLMQACGLVNDHILGCVAGDRIEP